jgi:hypothetical protein
MKRTILRILTSSKRGDATGAGEAAKKALPADEAAGGGAARHEANDLAHF